MKTKTLNLYSQLVDKLFETIDDKFKSNLLNHFGPMESLDPRWRVPLTNIRPFLKGACSQYPDIEPHLFLDGHLDYDDASALVLDLLWQKIHGRLDIKSTLHFYRFYKIQIADDNLLVKKTVDSANK